MRRKRHNSIIIHYFSSIKLFTFVELSNLTPTWHLCAPYDYNWIPSTSHKPPRFNTLVDRGSVLSKNASKIYENRWNAANWNIRRGGGKIGSSRFLWNELFEFYGCLQSSWVFSVILFKVWHCWTVAGSWLLSYGSSGDGFCRVAGAFTFPVLSMINDIRRIMQLKNSRRSV